MTVRFEDVASRIAYGEDSNFCDIYVLDTTIKDWAAFVDFVRTSGYRYHFTFGDAEGPLPEKPWEILHFDYDSGKPMPGLMIDVGGFGIRCMFIVWEEIEMDFERTAMNRERFARLVEFVQRLGDALGRDVRVTAESDSERPIILYDAAKRELRSVPEGEP
jgi:hypothetical protein